MATPVEARLQPVAGKLGKLLRMLSSDKAGEIVSAASAIMRTLETASLDIHDLADAITRKKFSEDDAMEIYRRGVEDGKRAAEDARCKSDFSNTDGTPDWPEVALFCQERTHRLGEKECQFVSDMAARTVWREPTPKQAKWLLSIFYKLGGRRQ